MNVVQRLALNICTFVNVPYYGLKSDCVAIFAILLLVSLHLKALVKPLQKRQATLLC